MLYEMRRMIKCDDVCGSFWCFKGLYGLFCIGIWSHLKRLIPGAEWLFFFFFFLSAIMKCQKNWNWTSWLKLWGFWFVFWRPVIGILARHWQFWLMFLWFSVVSSKHQNRTFIYTSSATFHITYNSLFTLVWSVDADYH